MKKIFLFVFVVFIACKSKLNIAIDNNNRQIQELKTQTIKHKQTIQEIKTTAVKCNNSILNQKINFLELSTFEIQNKIDYLEINNKNIELLYIQEVKQLQMYRKFIIFTILYLTLYFSFLTSSKQK